MEIPEGWPTGLMVEAALDNLPNVNREDVGFALKAALTAAPTPPAQEDEPDYWLIKSQDHDDPFLVDNKDTLELYLNAGLKLEAELYTRPQSDELRRAAEEVLRSFDNYMQQESRLVELIALIENLRAALEK
jgi:hypothetical protein